jgi:hypothetical protein
MKPIAKKTLICFGVVLFLISGIRAQNPGINKSQEKIPSFTKEKLKEKWTHFKNDKVFSKLLNEVEKKGFKKLEKENTQWGFEGEITDKSGKTKQVLFCVYDYVKDSDEKNSKQNCSVIWKKVDNKIYKAYIVFPPGETNMEKALSGAQEWYADEMGVHKAVAYYPLNSDDNSMALTGPNEMGDNDFVIPFASNWGKCFLACVQTGGTAPNIDVDIINGKLKVGGKTYTISCPGYCMFSAACALTALGVGMVLVETGVGLALAIAAAAACGLPCSACFGMCAIGCL